MATTINPLLPLSPSLKQNIPSSTSWVSCKPISGSMVTLGNSHFTWQRGQLAISVSFNPFENFDLSLYGDKDGKNWISLLKLLRYYKFFSWFLFDALSFRSILSKTKEQESDSCKNWYIVAKFPEFGKIETEIAGWGN